MTDLYVLIPHKAAYSRYMARSLAGPMTHVAMLWDSWIGSKEAESFVAEGRACHTLIENSSRQRQPLRAKP